MSEQTLLPCPFCGSKEIEVCEVGSGLAYVICRNKDCGCWPHNADKRELAIRLWNSRSAPDSGEGETLEKAAKEYIDVLEKFWGITERLHKNPVSAKAREKYLASAKGEMK